MTGITIEQANAGQFSGDPYREIERLRAEIATLRQRAEALENSRCVGPNGADGPSCLEDGAMREELCASCAYHDAEARLVTIRQRAETAETALANTHEVANRIQASRDEWRERALRVESDLSSERDLKRIAYEEVNSIAEQRDEWMRRALSLQGMRTVVKETIIPALEHLLEWTDWHRKRRQTPAMNEPNTGAREEARAALAAARKTLED